MSFWNRIFGDKPPQIHIENVLIVHGNGNSSGFHAVDIDASKARQCLFSDGAGGPGFSFEDAVRLGPGSGVEASLDKWLENRSNKHFLDYIRKNPGCEAKDCDAAVDTALAGDMSRWFSGR